MKPDECYPYTNIPDYFDKMMPDLSFSEMKVALVVMRETSTLSGWTWKEISLSDFAKKTGLAKNSIVMAIKKLIDKRVIKRQQLTENAYNDVYTIETTWE